MRITRITQALSCAVLTTSRAGTIGSAIGCGFRRHAAGHRRHPVA
jgi:hypothetical protein